MIRLLLLVALALGSLSLAQMTSEQTNHQQMNHGHGSAPAASAPLVSLSADGLEKLSGPAFDRAYLSMMIAHHQAAVDISKLLLPRLHDSQVKGWAEVVISGQASEIRELQAMFADFRLGTTDQQRAAAMTREMQGMLEMVRSSANPEEAFVTHMLDHHVSGILLATLALTHSNNDLIRLSAQGIVRAQAQQLYQYRQWKPAT